MSNLLNKGSNNNNNNNNQKFLEIQHTIYEKCLNFDKIFSFRMILTFFIPSSQKCKMAKIGRFCFLAGKNKNLPSSMEILAGTQDDQRKYINAINDDVD